MSAAEAKMPLPPYPILHPNLSRALSQTGPFPCALAPRAAWGGVTG